ncbi:type I restriction endonuclease subunit R [Pelagibaculum spongiae]|uniref:Type I restriction enzyme endonuclease subunit n=1 Tax=Pelagibaculum spongiae TaxID=2080658 RepID=A0A2V1GYC9_9GAMM|nr:HsdR family type I site-specific deoxyribonuclease [Pelagibaculum spongiae]PVZ65660.1 type I restriction endonuclease [Pelagibaculum spongiae]
MKFTEQQLEKAIIQLLGEQGYPHVAGSQITRAPEEVLIKDDLRAFLAKQYKAEGITQGEIDSVIRQLATLPASDVYDSNKQFCEWLSDGFLLKREDHNLKDLYIQLLDYPAVSVPAMFDDVLAQVAEPIKPYAATKKTTTDHNIYKIVNQLEIEGKDELRIPDGILYINGLPLVVFEFKSAIREDAATIHDAYEQLTTRYRRDIPQLFVFNALCIISDGVNNKMGSFFAPYEFFYAWRKVTGDESVEKDGINSLHTLLQGLFDQQRLRQVIRDFIYFPDKSNKEEKIVCRYPQFYAVNKLYKSIQLNKKPEGDGKGGTYFGATGCGKSFTMQFLARRLMKSVDFASPTIVLITDRNDLDDQLSKQFTNAKTYIGDATIVTVDSRQHLRDLLKDRKSGGVFLTTIHKFSEDIELLSQRSNIICISDEAHRSQINLDQKITVIDTESKKAVRKTFGFAYYLHQSLPNATYVGFTGTPIDATLDVFGQVADSYTMSESVKDEITVRIVYEGRAAKVVLDNSKLEEIEAYYQQCLESGASEYQVEESKSSSASMGNILGDPERIQALAKDFVAHYEKRIEEGSTIKGKAIFVSSSRQVAWLFYQQLRELRPQWFEVLQCEAGVTLSDKEKEKIKPMERVKMVMTRNKDDQKELYDLLKTKEYRKELDKQFKNEKSNFKIAIVVDMWLTGFDVPCLDSIYIDKPVQKHSLIQTISRVNRKYAGKDKGLVIDYIGIKSQMNKALAQFSKADESNFEDIQQSVVEVKNHLDLLRQVFHTFDTAPYFSGNPVAQLNCLNSASEFVLQTEKLEKRFMALMKRLKAAYDICCGSEQFSTHEKDLVHFYLAIRSIVFKLTRGEAPDTAQMNAKVRDMIAEAIKSDGVEEIFKLGEDGATAIDIFDDDYMEKIDKIKLPNTKIQLLQKLLKKALEEFKKTNKSKGVDFTKKFQSLVDKYNERKEEDAFTVEVHDEAISEMFGLMGELKTEMNSFEDLGISLEEKAFYDILKKIADKYQFDYQEDRLLILAAKVKQVVDDKAAFPDWNNRADIQAELRVALIMLLSKNGYPPVTYAEVYKEVFDQAEHFKAHRAV